MDPAPGPEPEPPEALAERRLPLRIFDEPAWVRGHQRRHSPLHFNWERGRFRAPGGTLYLGAAAHGAFVEAFAQHLAVSGQRQDYVVSQRLLEQSCLCIVTANRPMRLVDLTLGQTLRQISPDADARIATGSHAVSQRWAAAFASHPDRPDGVLYPCRRAPELHSIALFEPARTALAANCATNLLRDPSYLAAVLDHYDCALIA